MAVRDSVEMKKVTAGATNAYADFTHQVKSVLIKTTGDVYIAFDRAATTDDFLLSSSDGVVEVDSKCFKVGFISSGTPTVYVIGTR